MKISLILFLLLAHVVNGEQIFEAPDGWAGLEIPNPDPALVELLEGYASADGAIRVTAAKTGTLKSQEGLQAFLKANLKSLGEAGYKHELIQNTSIGRYEAKLIRGEIPSTPGYLYDGYLVLTSSAVYSLGFYIDPKRGTREDAGELLERFTFQGDPVQISSLPKSEPGENPSQKSSTSVTGLIIAALAALVVIAGIAWIIGRIRSSQPKD